AGAVAAAARAAGAEIRTAAEVTRLRVARGRVAGVALAGGEEVAARAVVSCIDPKTTLAQLLDAEHLGPSLRFAIGNVRARGAVAIVHFALDALPQLKGAPEDPRHLGGRIQVAAALDDLERAYDDAKYGRLPRRPYLELNLPSLADPSLAPAGKHVLTAWVQYPPYGLRHGSWEEHREALGDAVLATLEEVAPGIGRRLLARRVLTPLDLERRYGLHQGCLYHVEPALDQLLYLRPLPHFARHRGPVPGLYLGGAGTHGGLGASGLQGRNAARAVLDDG
ncbi:MAG: NAD(P)/FAD-dependent oxidoreductase, partial [Acidobacteria bacterium]